MDKIEPQEKFSNHQITESIKLMAFVMSRNRDQMITELSKDLEGEDLEFAVTEIDKILKGRNKIDRATVRLNQKNNGVSFSQSMKKQLTEANRKKITIDNWPENKNEQINWFLVNALRLLDAGQTQVLVDALIERLPKKEEVKHPTPERVIESAKADDLI